jgi:hypothetical protein
MHRYHDAEFARSLYNLDVAKGRGPGGEADFGAWLISRYGPCDDAVTTRTPAKADPAAMWAAAFERLAAREAGPGAPPVAEPTAEWARTIERLKARSGGRQ